MPGCFHPRSWMPDCFHPRSWMPDSIHPSSQSSSPTSIHSNNNHPQSLSPPPKHVFSFSRHPNIPVQDEEENGFTVFQMWSLFNIVKFSTLSLLLTRKRSASFSSSWEPSFRCSQDSFHGRRRDFTVRLRAWIDVEEIKREREREREIVRHLDQLFWRWWWLKSCMTWAFSWNDALDDNSWKWTDRGWD